MVCLSFYITVRAVEIHGSSVINATALSAEDPMLPASACKPTHTQQCHPFMITPWCHRVGAFFTSVSAKHTLQQSN